MAFVLQNFDMLKLPIIPRNPVRRRVRTRPLRPAKSFTLSCDIKQLTSSKQLFLPRAVPPQPAFVWPAEKQDRFETVRRINRRKRKVKSEDAFVSAVSAVSVTLSPRRLHLRNSDKPVWPPPSVGVRNRDATASRKHAIYGVCKARGDPRQPLPSALRQLPQWPSVRARSGRVNRVPHSCVPHCFRRVTM
ncbi:hypothetical protein EVAR_81056_1 [Eumeta japonica]|uniref:Uncharacterized protein n=1 Tax=Eumeta variegata TaxID=151549 RepID=A0A4C1T903_EUMVA|nr:hypothetical protein EVAR_81056_1 [Eumeta japonica]